MHSEFRDVSLRAITSACLDSITETYITIPAHFLRGEYFKSLLILKISIGCLHGLSESYKLLLMGSMGGAFGTAVHPSLVRYAILASHAMGWHIYTH